MLIMHYPEINFVKTL